MGMRGFGLAPQIAAVAWYLNSVLVNRYGAGDMLGWQGADETDLGDAPVLAAMSFGAERVFRMRPGGGAEGVARALATDRSS